MSFFSISVKGVRNGVSLTIVIPIQTNLINFFILRKCIQNNLSCVDQGQHLAVTKISFISFIDNKQCFISGLWCISSLFVANSFNQISKVTL